MTYTPDMSYEVETKVLFIDDAKLIQKLETLGAKKILDTRLVVDWFHPVGEKEGEEKWYLRMRSNSEGTCELTWKGISTELGASRKHKEINMPVQDPQIMTHFLEAIGMQQYAHQEKDRKSFVLKDWRIDIDSYPNMPPYAEIEGHDESHIQEALKFFDLSENETYSGGERKLIQEKFGLDWLHMSFS